MFQHTWIHRPGLQNGSVIGELKKKKQKKRTTIIVYCFQFGMVDFWFTLSSSWTKVGTSSASPRYIGFVISTQSFNRACENG